MVDVEERRHHDRLPVRTTLRCRRLGRGGFDEEVTSLDLSAGGALLYADHRLDVGDVVALGFDVGGFSLGIKALVVASREVPARDEERLVHVAFTGLSADRLTALDALLAEWAQEAGRRQPA